MKNTKGIWEEINLKCRFNSNFSHTHSSKVQGRVRKTCWEIHYECYYWTLFVGSHVDNNFTQLLIQFQLNKNNRPFSLYTSACKCQGWTNTFTSVNQNLKWIKQHKTTSTRPSLYWFCHQQCKTLLSYSSLVFFKRWRWHWISWTDLKKLQQSQ